MVPDIYQKLNLYDIVWREEQQKNADKIKYDYKTGKIELIFFKTREPIKDSYIFSDLNCICPFIGNDIDENTILKSLFIWSEGYIINHSKLNPYKLKLGYIEWEQYSSETKEGNPFW